MTKVITTPSNGVKATPETKDLPKLTAEVKPIKKIELPQDQDLPPLEDRLHRLNVLFSIQTKYNKYIESLQKLNEFEIKKDGERSFVRLSDDNRNDFTTSHPELVQEVTDFVKQRIKHHIKAIEPLLKW